MNDTALTFDDSPNYDDDIPDLLPLRDITVLPAQDSSPELPASLFLIPADVIEYVIRTRTQTGNMVDSLLVRHLFSDGCYARELTIPAGTLATARRHLTHHLCILTRGECTIWEEGREPEVLTAPCTFIGRPGTRRIGYFHQDTVWLTVFPNPHAETDPAAILNCYTEIPTPTMTRAQIEGYLDGMALNSDPASRLIGTVAVSTFAAPVAVNDCPEETEP